MPIKDILLPLVGEPSAAAIAAIVGARVTAVAVEEEIVVRPKVTISDDDVALGVPFTRKTRQDS
jgi:hypothetical protein